MKTNTKKPGVNYANITEGVHVNPEWYKNDINSRIREAEEEGKNFLSYQSELHCGNPDECQLARETIGWLRKCGYAASMASTVEGLIFMAIKW